MVRGKFKFPLLPQSVGAHGSTDFLSYLSGCTNRNAVTQMAMGSRANESWVIFTLAGVLSGRLARIFHALLTVRTGVRGAGKHVGEITAGSRISQRTNTSGNCPSPRLFPENRFGKKCL